MPHAQRVLGIIAARGGSKGLPRKNVLPAGGRPLIAWTVEAALGARCIDRVVLSTDDDEIAEVAARHGCEAPFRRPAHLAGDTAGSVDVVLDALERLPGYDVVVLLQPTSPLRTAADIDAAHALMQHRRAPACVSVCAVDVSPYWMFRLDGADRLGRLLEPPPEAHRRQDLPAVHMLNGAVYLARVPWLLQTRSFVGEGTVGHEMPRERSLDIDTAEDLEAFERRVASAAR